MTTLPTPDGDLTDPPDLDAVPASLMDDRNRITPSPGSLNVGTGAHIARRSRVTLPGRVGCASDGAVGK